METLAKLTRRQIEVLDALRLKESPERGVSLLDVAQALRVTPPSALAHLTPLESLGLVSRYRGKTRITPRGREVLEEYRRHHRVAEILFGGVGLPPAAACTAAREIDMALSHRTVDAVCRVQNHPTACPHGEPILPCHGDSAGLGARPGH